MKSYLILQFQHTSSRFCSDRRANIVDVLVWTASHPRGLMALLASQKDERKV